MALSAQERRQRASMAAHAMHAVHDGSKITQKARDTYREQFREEARRLARERGEGDLPDAEIERRAYHLFKAHMARLSILAAKERRLRRETKAKTTKKVAS